MIVLGLVLVTVGLLALYAARRKAKRLRRAVSHTARDAGLAATMSAAHLDGKGIEHATYLAARAMGDARALKRGRLPQRLVRRAAMRRIGRGLFGRW